MQPITFAEAVNKVINPALNSLRMVDQYEDDLSTAESLRFWLFDMHDCHAGRDSGCQVCSDLENADLSTLKEMYRQATLTNEDRKVMHDTALGVENL